MNAVCILFTVEQLRHEYLLQFAQNAIPLKWTEDLQSEHIKS